MTSTEDILADVVSFLNNTLAGEDLSPIANQRRLSLLHKILSKDPVTLSYVDMNGSHKNANDFEFLGECYEELESSWSGSGTNSNVSRNGYSHTLPSANGKLQRFSFFFGNGLGDSKIKDFNKSCVDTTDCPIDCSKRNSILSDSDNSLSPSSVKSEDSMDVISISASAIKYSAVKCGSLYKKEKVLFVEHTKRLWVALLGTTLYIYTSEKDVKPLQCINVDDYNGRPIAVNQSYKKEFGFEIICPGKKTYQFYSNSKSEMESWILSINHSMPLPQTSCVVPSVPSTSGSGSLSGTDSLDFKLTECSEKRSSSRDVYRYENVDSLAERELPSLPTYLHYDTPNPLCRAVTSDSINDRIPCEGLLHETFYHSIDESLADQLATYDYPVRKNSVPRSEINVDENYNPVDNVYYNILEHVRENIENKSNDTISSSNVHTKDTSSKDEDNVCQRNGISRIRQLIQKMEDINNQNNSFHKKNSSITNSISKLNSIPSTSKEDIYELVNSPTYVNINA